MPKRKPPEVSDRELRDLTKQGIVQRLTERGVPERNAAEYADDVLDAASRIVDDYADYGWKESV